MLDEACLSDLSSDLQLLRVAHRYALGGTADGRLILWNVDGCALVRAEALRIAALPVTCVTVDWSSLRALCGADDGTLQMWSLDTVECVQTLEGHCAPLRCVSADWNGGQAVSGSEDGILKLWNLNNGVCQKTFPGPRGIHSLSVHWSSRRLFGAGRENPLRLWDLHDLQSARVLSGHWGFVTFLNVDWAAERALSASEDSTVKIWNTECGSCLKTLRPYKAWVTCAVAHWDSGRLLSGNSDGTLDLWNHGVRGSGAVPSGHTPEHIDVCGAFCRALRGHRAIVRVLSADWCSSRALSGAADGTLKLWDVDLATCLQTVEGHEGTVCILHVYWNTSEAVVCTRSCLRLWDLHKCEDVLAVRVDGTQCMDFM